MIERMHKLAAVAVMTLVTLSWAAAALADEGRPEFVTGDPAPGTTAHDPPERVSVTFDETLDPLASTLSVFACDERVDDGEVIVADDTMSVGLEETPPGRYRVEYTATGADDTPEERQEPTTGSYTFSLHTRRCNTGGDDPRDRPDDPGPGHHHDDEHGGKGRDRHPRDRHGSGGGRDHRSHADHPSGGTHNGGGDHASGDDDHASHPGAARAEHAGGHRQSPGHANGSHDPRHDRGHQDGRASEERDEPPPPAAADPGGESDALELVLVLALPAVIGAIGGTLLRRATI